MFFKKLRTENKELKRSFKNKKCIICSKPAVGCHIKSVGSGGPDEEWNMLAMCVQHHQIQHSMSWQEFVDIYPIVFSHLRSKGWDFFNGRLIHNK